MSMGISRGSVLRGGCVGDARSVVGEGGVRGRGDGGRESARSAAGEWLQVDIGK